ncbi:MAG TPA: DUF308 domain-containing protein [Devosiaceae bacterium]|nr:DUF308 domain-containing protein [Devosiaceae bacterium]
MSSALTALRGVLMLLAGLYAIFFPGLALTWLVVLGGALFLIDGVLGLWSLTFGHAKTGNFWFDIVRNVLAVIAGVLILLSPLLATIFTTIFLVYVIGIQAIIVGVMELVMVFRARQVFAHIWPVLLSGILYVLFGLLLLFFPLSSALGLVTLGGVLAIIFAIGLFGLAWRLHKAGM